MFKLRKSVGSKEGRVLIVGGGITGLALLEQRGIVPDVVEKMPNWSKTGYGITVLPAGMAVLRKLELITAIREAGTTSDDFHFLTPEGKMIREIKLHNDNIDCVTLNRGDLHRALRGKLKDTHVRFGMSVTKLRQTRRGVKATFSDRTTATYDFVVGADGVRSKVRSLLFPKVQPQYAGAAIWTFFLPRGVKLPTSKTVLQTWGEDEFMGIFPIKDGAAVTFAAPLEAGVAIDSVKLAERFKDIHFLGQTILGKMETPEMYSGYLNEVKMGTWHKGRVVLAGDAAHAMLPATGMGASMGMQDALALAELLGSIEPEDWATVPRQYQEKRKRTVDLVQFEAHMVGHAMFMQSPAKDLRNAALKLVPQFVVSHQLNRL